MMTKNDGLVSMDAVKIHEDIEKLDKQVYVEDGHIVINVNYEYNIALSRCDTNDKIVAWVKHLCVKTWVTKPILKRFIHLAQKYNGLEPSVV